MYALAFAASPFELQWREDDTPVVVDCSHSRVLSPVSWPRAHTFSRLYVDTVTYATAAPLFQANPSPFPYCRQLLNHDPSARPTYEEVSIPTELGWGNALTTCHRCRGWQTRSADEMMNILLVCTSMRKYLGWVGDTLTTWAAPYKACFGVYGYIDSRLACSRPSNGRCVDLVMLHCAVERCIQSKQNQRFDLCSANGALRGLTSQRVGATVTQAHVPARQHHRITHSGHTNHTRRASPYVLISSTRGRLRPLHGLRACVDTVDLLHLHHSLVGVNQVCAKPHRYPIAIGASITRTCNNGSCAS